MGTAKERAADLLAAHHKKIGRAAFRVGRKLDPAIAGVSATAGEASGANMMRALEAVLRTGDEAPLLATVKSTVELRRLAGYSLPQFVAMSHTYLPVIRRVFLQHEPDVHLALEAYNAVESRLLPLIVQMLNDLFAHGAGSFGDEEVTAPSEFTGRNSTSPFMPISVEEEITSEE